ncbi:MAG: peroxidase-related enzyme [Thermoplasmatota archaeon]
MSWIKEIEENDAKGRLKKVYQKISRDRGKLSNIMKVHSLNPTAMEAHLELYLSIMFKNSSLTREECEIIGVVVSSVNRCEYCVEHHSQALNHYWKDMKKVKELIEKYEESKLTKKQSTMVKYVKNLTEEPSSISKRDISELKDVGLTDKNILDINLVASYFNFVNRIALGLGVVLTPEEIKGYEY